MRAKQNTYSSSEQKPLSVIKLHFKWRDIPVSFIKN